METQKQVITETNKILYELKPNVCYDLAKASDNDVKKLNTFVYNNYPEIRGYYFDNDCRIFCTTVITKHILTGSIDYVSSITF